MPTNDDALSSPSTVTRTSPSSVTARPPMRRRTSPPVTASARVESVSRVSPPASEVATVVTPSVDCAAMARPKASSAEPLVASPAPPSSPLHAVMTRRTTISPALSRRIGGGW